MIIIMRFGENVLGPKYIDLYEFQGVRDKTEKAQEHDLNSF